MKMTRKDRELIVEKLNMLEDCFTNYSSVSEDFAKAAKKLYNEVIDAENLLYDISDRTGDEDLEELSCNISEATDYRLEDLADCSDEYVDYRVFCDVKDDIEELIRW